MPRYTIRSCPEIKNWEQANAVLGNKDRVELYYATALVRAGDEIHIRHHWTHIITYLPDGNMRVYNHGYYTPTTKQRLNSHMPGPWRVYQKDWTWYFYSTRNRNWWKKPVREWEEGTLIHRPVGKYNEGFLI